MAPHLPLYVQDSAMKGEEAAVNALATPEARDVNPEPHIRNTRPVPQPGDVVASRATARSDAYTIRILPDAAYEVAARYPDAIATVRQRARRLKVDGWFTADHTHFVRVAHWR
jgi:hypothetical protein